MGTIASQITSLTGVYSTVYSGADQSKHQSSTSLAFVWGIHRGPVNSPHKWPVTRKMFPFDDVIMTHSKLSVLMHTHCFQAHPCDLWPVHWINIKISFYQYRKSHGGDKMILRPSYLHNEISYTGKMASLYWIGGPAYFSHVCVYMVYVLRAPLSCNSLQGARTEGSHLVSKHNKPVNPIIAHWIKGRLTDWGQIWFTLIGIYLF